MKIGVYVGSFAPVHNGHVAIMKEALRYCDRVIVVPTMEYWNKEITIPIEKRIKALHLFETDDIWIDVNLGDIYSQYTSDLLRRLQARYPNDELMFIMGADGLPTFDRWHEYQYILDNYHFLVMNREGCNVKEDMYHLRKRNYTIFNVPLVDVSSTYIREHLNEPELLKGKIDERVIAILKE